ncbi:MBL fold metallo-hydrolase [Paracoccus sp. MBLB3053]|uniref:MBL fold metallo-hydrolase n=1 Tax=Paracoccus aurantius TaxID=3073814 RepID=A0ABU2HVP8_9RHOB|nr:MBL fold metallo-hydrolase [Paracoccus sp. MBLB3053]MDS9468812.1 MBL fold metallo-hydrolase [Paracoccus sp. MBLB3053]
MHMGIKPQVSRQRFTGLMACATGTALAGFRAQAQPVHSLRHGRFEITVLSDGFLTLPAEVLLPDATPEQRGPLLTALGGDASGARVQANVPVIRAGDDLILIDNGAGGNFQPSTGRLEDNLKAAGIEPARITKVILTHAHPDHSGATLGDDGKLRYPNAHYYVGRKEWDFWTDPQFETHNAAALHGFALGAKRDLLAVEDRLTLLRDGDEIVAGLSVNETPGHTPGHISVELAGSEPLLITGDACTHDVIFFAHPGWHFGFDTDPELALSNRQKLLDRAASERLKLLGYHWSYPGIGRAERHDGAYRFVPG